MICQIYICQYKKLTSYIQIRKLTMKSRISKTAQDICSFCQQQPQDMLILSCRHNLCLQCATEVYNVSSKNDNLICQICLRQTKLDYETIVCLRSLFAKNFQKMPFKISNSLLDENDHSVHIVPQQRKQLNLLPHDSKRTTDLQDQVVSTVDISCTKHNEKIAYFCFDCNNYKICSECMLSQNHRDHKILTLKKATQHIRQNINTISRQKMKLKNLLEKDCQNLISRKQNSQRQYQMNLNDLKLTFDSLGSMIQQKYQQLKILMQQLTHRKLQIMQGAIAQIRQKIDLINRTIQFQEQFILQSINNAKYKEKHKLFEYYLNELYHPTVNFQPNLPSFIPEVYQQILNKDKFFDNIRKVLQQFRFIQQNNQQSHNVNQQNDNINYISLIDNEQVHNNLKDITYDPQILFKNNFTNQQKLFISSISPLRNKSLTPWNRNIIQQYVYAKNAIQNDKISLLNQKISLQKGKRSKQTNQILKNKTKDHFRNKQMTSSRKKEFGQSIINATDIINKIQQRSFKI